jgi:putative endonuclease
VTNDLIKRVWQHKNKLTDSFTKKYNIDRLIYFEQTGDVNSAIAREKQLKRWRRAWKEDLINEKNPAWQDLYFDLL